jgi:hypothetical protein
MECKCPHEGNEDYAHQAVYIGRLYFRARTCTIAPTRYCGFIHSSYGQLYNSRHKDCSIWECCGNPVEDFYILEVATSVLSPGRTRFRRQPEALAELW